MERLSDPTVFHVVDRGERSPVRPDALGKLAGSTSLPSLLRSLRGKRPLTMVCPLCGWTQKKYEETHLMGCGLCHTDIADLIAPSEEPSTS